MTVKRTQTSYRVFFKLNVGFRATKKYLEIDREIQKLLGKKASESGISADDKMRNLGFEFDREKEADTARQLLKKGGYNSSITRYETDTP